MDANSEFSFTDSDVTKASLLRIVQEMYGARAPQNAGTLFLRDQGLDSFEFIEFTLAVQQNFRITFVGEEFDAFLDNSPNVEEMTKFLHQSKVRHWK